MRELTSCINGIETTYTQKVPKNFNQGLTVGSFLLDMQCYSDSSKHSSQTPNPNEESVSNSDLKLLGQYDLDLIEAINYLGSEEEENAVVDSTIE